VSSLYVAHIADHPNEMRNSRHDVPTLFQYS